MVSGGDRRFERIHLQNIRIAASARRHHFDDRIGIPFLCECDDDLCREFVVVPLAAFERTLRDRLTIVSTGHKVEGSAPVSQREGYEVVRVSNGRSRTA